MVAAFKWDALVADRRMTSQVFMDILPNPLGVTRRPTREFGALATV
jgi:hypothetical protein